MKRLYPKLAWQSLKHNGKFYFPYYYNKFGQESRAASPAFFPSRA